MMLRLSTTHKTGPLWACLVGNSCTSDVDSVAENLQCRSHLRGFNLWVVISCSRFLAHVSLAVECMCGQCPTCGVFRCGK